MFILETLGLMLIGIGLVYTAPVIFIILGSIYEATVGRNKGR